MKTFSSVCFCAMLMCSFGCQRVPTRPEGMPELTPCTVAVTFGGERLQNVAVLIQSKDSQTSHWPAGGKTDSEGKALMKTAAYYDGVVPGEYRISFQKRKPEGMGPGVPLIPLKYAANASKETITVTTEQSEYTFSLDGLEKSVKK